MINIKSKKLPLYSAFVILIAFAVLIFLLQNKNKTQPGVTLKQAQQKEQLQNSQVSPSPRKATEVIAQDLKIPWELVFLPQGTMLVTERPGTLLLLNNGTKIPISGIVPLGEGGLLGMAVHPNFKNNHFIYLYETTASGNQTVNEVDRYVLDGTNLKGKKVIISGMHAAANHDGGRLAFGPNGDLYFTVGDAQNENSSQNVNSLNGKILRVKDDGSIPADNPFGNAVYSYGHRNPQGLAWDNQSRLWATEHGRSGALSGLDELNLIEKGKNYGWPTIQGNQTKQGMVTPVINSGPTTTWAPSGALYFRDSIFFAGLRGEALYQYDTKTKTLKEHFKNEFGRLRTVVLGPDNYFYILTNNTDGRGNPKPNDDKIIKVDSNLFF